ncbi:MAG: redoxin domain-containing protein [Bacteroidia bacterium]|nr:redoxin domain-containing protein [Bacteroidia bacterium]
MKLRILVFLLLAAFIANGQKVKVMNYSSLDSILSVKSDSIKVVNFWATWCGPCIAELPYFVKAQESFSNNKVTFTYVSLDFSKEADKVLKMAGKKGLTGNLYLLKDDPNYYVRKLSSYWEGQIPITLIVKPDGDYIFRFEPFENYEQLSSFIIQNL